MANELETKKRNVTAPVADICEDAGKVMLRLEMPGVSKDMIDVRIENDELIIQGMRGEPEVRGKYLIHERRKADYLKRYTLDDTIDREKIDALMKNGILNLTLHLKEASKPRKIQIKAR